MTLDPAKLLDQIATLRQMLDVEQAARIASEKRAADAEARATGLEAEVRDRATEIEELKLTIAKLQRNTFGASSERGKKLLDQLELQLAELEERVAEDNASDKMKSPPGAGTSARDDIPSRKPARRPLPSHLPRERIVHPAPSACPCCGGALRKLGEDVTETLEHVPAQWKVIQHAREVLLPQMRGHHAGAGTLTSDCAGPGRTAAPGPGPLCQVSRAPSAQPAERHL